MDPRCSNIAAAYRMAGNYLVDVGGDRLTYDEMLVEADRADDLGRWEYAAWLRLRAATAILHARLDSTHHVPGWVISAGLASVSGDPMLYVRADGEAPWHWYESHGWSFGWRSEFCRGEPLPPQPRKAMDAAVWQALSLAGRL
jgi:hypothetical protein